MSEGILVGVWLLVLVAAGAERLWKRREVGEVDHYRRKNEKLSSGALSIPVSTPSVSQTNDVAYTRELHGEIDDLLDAASPEQWDQPLHTVPTRAQSTRAAAYAHMPASAPTRPVVPVVHESVSTQAVRREPLSTSHPEMRRRRRVMTQSLGGAVAVTTVASVLTSWAFFEFLAVVAWLLALAYVGLVYHFVIRPEEGIGLPRPSLRLLPALDDDEFDDEDDFVAEESEEWRVAPRRVASF